VKIAVEKQFTVTQTICRGKQTGHDNNHNVQTKEWTDHTVFMRGIGTKLEGAGTCTAKEFNWAGNWLRSKTNRSANARIHTCIHVPYAHVHTYHIHTCTRTIYTCTHVPYTHVHTYHIHTCTRTIYTRTHIPYTHVHTCIRTLYTRPSSRST